MIKVVSVIMKKIQSIIPDLAGLKKEVGVLVSATSHSPTHANTTMRAGGSSAVDELISMMDCNELDES